MVEDKGGTAVSWREGTGSRGPVAGGQAQVTGVWVNGAFD